MNSRSKIIIGIILMAGAILSANIKVDTTWHYFGTGVIFGIGLTLFIQSFSKKN